MFAAVIDAFFTMAVPYSKIDELFVIEEALWVFDIYFVILILFTYFFIMLDILDIILELASLTSSSPLLLNLAEFEFISSSAILFTILMLRVITDGYFLSGADILFV